MGLPVTRAVINSKQKACGKTALLKIAGIPPHSTVQATACSDLGVMLRECVCDSSARILVLPIKDKHIGSVSFELACAPGRFHSSALTTATAMIGYEGREGVDTHRWFDAAVKELSISG